MCSKEWAGARLRMLYTKCVYKAYIYLIYNNDDNNNNNNSMAALSV